MSEDKDPAKDLFDIGCILSDNGKHKEAIEYYDRAISAKPYYLEAWLHKGSSFYEMGMNREAIECFDKATQIEPNYADAWHNKGACLFILGRYQEAIEAFDVAISFQPKNVDFWYAKAGSFFKMEKYQEAIEFFDKVISIEPNHLDAWYNKGISLYFIEKNQKAIECFDMIISIKPDHAYGWHHKGTTFFRMGRYEEAIECYKKTKAIDSKAYLDLMENILDDIDEMQGYKFEKFMGAIYKKMGYSVKHTSLSGDQGADLVISRYEERSAVQIKRHTGKVSNKAIQEVVASKGFYKCNSCIVVTNSYFTKSAIDLGKANNVKLIDRDEFESMIKNL